jgi:glycerophosphoryl diester phosphodiesterase
VSVVSPLISAHRGNCGVAGLPADERYDRAIQLGVDYVELDVRRAADGVYVNYHDDLTPSGRAIGSLKYAGLKAELGAELLTLAELLQVIAGRAGVQIDLKEQGKGAEIVGLVLAAQAESRHIPIRSLPGGEGRVVFTTGEVESIRAIKEQFPGVRAGLTLGTDMKGAPAWATVRERLGELFPGRRLNRSRADFVAAHQQLARIRLLRYCTRRRMAAWVWTVDQEAEIARFMADPRVTTLITNRPDLALRFRSA